MKAKRLLFSFAAFFSAVLLGHGATVIIPTNAVWRYLADGTDQGTAWQSPGFDDASWPSGPAQLGYGDGDEATVIPSGPDGTARYITTYFRKTVVIPGVVSNATLRLLRDDGAVVYINGVEVRRDNMPAGTISYGTLATVSVGGSDETTFFESTVPPSVFVPGTNVIAVEVHQNSAISSDLSFALGLSATLAPTLPVVTVAAIDSEAREIPPWLDIPSNPGVFEFRRTGSTNNALTVAVRWSGTASNGVDYAYLSNTVTFPIGNSIVDVFVNALDDTLVEGTETVVATVLPVACLECYVPGSDATATVYIIDNEPVNSPPTVSIASPRDGASFTEPAAITLIASAADPDGYDTLLYVEFFANGKSLGVRTNFPTANPLGPFVLTWENVSAGLYTLAAVAVDSAGATGTSAPVHITVVATNPPPVTNVTLVALGSEWKYQDQCVDLGTAWRAYSYNDAAWGSGPAQLGYGDGDEATVIGPPPDATTRCATTYFRRGFMVSNAEGIARVSGRLLEDDGAVIYLNGAEVFRSNMPTGAVTFGTLALAATENQVVDFSVPPGLLVSGWNMLAVEMHQVNVTSSDLSFDLELRADISATSGPPHVVVVIPQEGDTFSAPTNIFLGANASAANGISRVDFFSDGAFIGKAIGPLPSALSGWGLAWSNPPAGTHALTAVVTDMAELKGTSAPVHVTIQGSEAERTVISLAVIDPLASEPLRDPNVGTFEIRRRGNLSAAIPVSFTLSGTASNGIDYQYITNRAVIAAGATQAWVRVVPLNDNLVEGTETVTLTIDWLACPAIYPVPPECYLVGASNSGTVFIADLPPTTNTAPTVQINQPADGSSFTAPANITLQAYAQDPEDGYNVTVDFYSGTNRIGRGIFVPTLCPSPYCPFFAFSWSNVPPGTYTLTARATDSAGATGVSAPVHVSVQGETTNRPPVAYFLSPRGGSVFTQGMSIVLRAAANDPDGTVARVEFRTEAGLIGFAGAGATMGTNFALMWSNPPAGDFLLRAVAVDNLGARGTSAPVSVTIYPRPGPPMVALTQPTNQAVFIRPVDILLEAATRDPDGYASSVEFFADDLKIGESRLVFIQAPPPGETLHLQFTWTNPPAGPHVLHATTTDNSGLRGTSAPVSISVQEPVAREEHGIGLYSGNYNGGPSVNHERGDAFVVVDRPGRHIILALTAHEPVLWHVQATSNTVIEKVILGGYYRQDITGVGSEVTIVPRYYDEGSGTSDYLELGTAVNSVRFQRGLARLCDLTGLDLASFQGGYVAPANAFVINAVQADERLQCSYPQPVDPSTLPNIAFALSFRSPGGGDSPVYTKHYTLAGPVDGGLLLPSMRVVPDAGGRYYYGTEAQDVWKIDAQNGSATLMTVPDLSWPTGLAFDPHRNRILLSSLGGEGFLYAYLPELDQWSVVHSMENRDVNGIVYHPPNDSIYAVNDTYDEYGPRVIFRLNSNGELQDQIALPLMPFDFGPSGYASELVSAGDYLVLLVEPTYRGFYVSSARESRIYLVDPRTGEVRLTYRHRLFVDSDNDGIADDFDLCPNTPRGERVDEHGCSASQRDSDGDGVVDSLDACPRTAPGAPVNDRGCSIAQLCPCDGRWTNHLQYVQCVSQTAEQFLASGWMTSAQRDAIVQEADHSTCGRQEPRLTVATNCTVVVNSGEATRWIVEWSTNLLNWTAFQTNTISGTDIHVDDPDLQSTPTRFYRVRAE